MAQLARAAALQAVGQGFKSPYLQCYKSSVMALGLYDDL